MEIARYTHDPDTASAPEASTVATDCAYSICDAMPKIAVTTPMNAAITDADAKRVPRASASPPPSATTSTPSGTPPAAQSPISPMAASSEPHDKAADPAKRHADGERQHERPRPHRSGEHAARSDSPDSPSER